MKNLIRILSAFGLLIMLCLVALPQSKTPISLRDIIGEYSKSYDKGGDTIEFKADGTFQSVRTNDTNKFFYAGTYKFDGKVLDLTYDSKAYKVTDVTEEFEDEFAKNNSSSKLISGIYVPVRWGERMYLIDSLRHFCTAVNLGLEPLDKELKVVLMFTGNNNLAYNYLRKGDENKTANGLPEVSEEYKSYLLAKPLVGKILEIKREDNTTMAQINLGRRDGIKEKMRLISNQKTNNTLLPNLIVETVEEDTAWIRVSSYYKVGDEVFTRYQGPRTLKDFFQSDYFK